MPKYCILFFLAVAAMFSCAPPAATEPPKAVATPSVPAAANKDAWQRDWESVIDGARKEGRLSVYANMRPEAREAITKAMKERFGIETEFTVGRSPELMSKLKMERQAGLYLADVGFLGPTTFANDLAPLGILASFDTVLILPDVQDPGKWIAGRLPYLDKGHLAIKPVVTAQPSYIMNTDKVKPGEINHALDLLNPKWKGQIAISDPSIAGGGNDWFAFTVLEVFGTEKGLQFMKDLAKQDPVVSRDERLLTEWVAKGKYSLGIAPSKAIVAEFIKMQTPMDFVDTKDQRSVSPGSGLVNVFKDAPHPNAMKVFINWVLSQEGNSIFAPASEYPSARVDVSKDSFLPILVPRPSDVDPLEKYPDYDKRKADLAKVAAQVFGGLLK